jgi:hypothetical protein
MKIFVNTGSQEMSLEPNFLMSLGILSSQGSKEKEFDMVQ